MGIVKRSLIVLLNLNWFTWCNISRYMRAKFCSCVEGTPTIKEKTFILDLFLT